MAGLSCKSLLSLLSIRRLGLGARLIDTVQYDTHIPVPARNEPPEGRAQEAARIPAIRSGGLMAEITRKYLKIDLMTFSIFVPENPMSLMMAIKIISRFILIFKF